MDPDSYAHTHGVELFQQVWDAAQPWFVFLLEDLVRAHGLGGCWVAGDKKPYAPSICRLLGAPAEFRLVSLVAAGYPAETPVKEKRSLIERLRR